MVNCWRNVTKSGIKSTIILKKNWLVKHCTNYLKTKTKSYDGKIDTNFHDDEMPKEGSHCICLLE